MTRILIITQHFPPEKSGNSFRISDLSRNLEGIEVDVKIISPHPTFPFGNFERKWERKVEKEKDGVDVFNIWNWQPQSSDPNFLNRMAYYLIFPLHSLFLLLKKRNEFDVIITTSPPIFTHISGYFAKKILNKKWVVDVRDLWIDASVSLGFIDESSFFKKLTEFFEKLCLKSCDFVTVTTSKIKERLIDKHQLKNQNKFIFLPNGVDIDFVKPVSSEKKNQIIYTGNLGHAQDLKSPILAMKILKEKYEIKLLVIGDGDTKEELKRFVTDEGLDEVVEFKDPIPRKEIPKYLSESSIGLAPLKKLESLDYAVPSKIFEYLACKLPFMVSGKGEIRKIAKESKAGVVVENNPESFAEKISRLLDDIDKLEEMGNRGREFVERHYDRRKLAKKLKDEIEGLK